MLQYENSFRYPNGDPMTAYDIWASSKTPVPYHQWTPSREVREHLEKYFGGRRKECHPVAPP